MVWYGKEGRKEGSHGISRMSKTQGRAEQEEKQMETHLEDSVEGIDTHDGSDEACDIVLVLVKWTKEIGKKEEEGKQTTMKEMR